MITELPGGGPEKLAHYCHHKAEKPEAQRGYVSGPTSHSKQVAERGLGSRVLDPKAESDAPRAGSGWTELGPGRRDRETPSFFYPYPRICFIDCRDRGRERERESGERERGGEREREGNAD